MRAWLGGWGGDLRLGLRVWRRQPGFAVLAIATLALGIGAATALFTVVNTVALRPLPLPHPQRWVALQEFSRASPGGNVSWPDFRDWQAANRSFAGLAAVRGSDMILSHLGTPAYVVGARVTANFFSLLGARPALGRVFTAADDRPGAPGVVVLSPAFFASRLGGDPAWIGRPLDLDGRLRTIVGVMPLSFSVPGIAGAAVRFYTPLGPAVARNPSLRSRANRALLVIGRLRPGVSLAQARREMAVLAARLARRHAQDAGLSARVERLLDLLIGSTRPGLLWLLAAAGVLLLAACANVGSLLLARAATERRADAVRMALGAAPGRLLRRHLAEALWLAAAAGALGLLLAWALAHALGAGLAADLPRGGQLVLDWRVALFAVGVALFATLLCGLAPGWRAAAAPPAAALQLDTPIGARSARGGFVALEAALAVLLLAGAGLLVRSLRHLEALSPGFQPRHVLSFVIGLPPSHYPSRARQMAFFRRALRQLASLPGVTAVGGAFPLPFTGDAVDLPFAVVNRAAPPPGHAPAAALANVRGNYFAAMGIRLLRGRAFPARLAAKAPRVAVVDDVLARRYFPAGALGQPIAIGGGAPRTIIGVVAHVATSSLSAPPLPEVYIPQSQSSLLPGALYFVLRTHTGALALAAAARARIAALDPDLPLAGVRTMRQRVGATLRRRRLALDLLATFAGLALLLAALGLYAVLSYAVARRAREIGVRMALGATPGRVLAMVLGQGLRWVAVGAAAGFAAAVALGRLAAAFLPGISPADPLALGAALLVLLAVAAPIAVLPARRAARLDPLRALRNS
jgi:putative ABC transport system permease protein